MCVGIYLDDKLEVYMMGACVRLLVDTKGNLLALLKLWRQHRPRPPSHINILFFGVFSGIFPNLASFW